VTELLQNPPSKDQIDEVLDKVDEARVDYQKPHPASAQKTDDKDASTPSDVQAVQSKVLKIGQQRQALSILTKIIRNCDHEKLEKKRFLTEAALRLWSAHTKSFLDFFSELLDEAGKKATAEKASLEKSSGDKKGPRLLTQDDLNGMKNIIKCLLSFAEAATVATALTSESLRAPLRDLALSEKEKEGVRFFAAFAYAESWDTAGIELVRNFLKDLQNSVLRHAALQKMLHDYRFQLYQVANVAAFRELIVETEIALHGGTKAEKGERIASLIEQAKDDVGK
jgi:hypothetical protein